MSLQARSADFARQHHPSVSQWIRDDELSWTYDRRIGGRGMVTDLTRQEEPIESKSLGAAIVKATSGETPDHGPS